MVLIKVMWFIKPSRHPLENRQESRSDAGASHILLNDLLYSLLIGSMTIETSC